MNNLSGGKKNLPYGIPKESFSEVGSDKPREKHCSCEKVIFTISHFGQIIVSCNTMDTEVKLETLLDLKRIIEKNCGFQKEAQVLLLNN